MFYNEELHGFIRVRKSCGMRWAIHVTYMVVLVVKLEKEMPMWHI
jgi:hypothetical protein